MPEYKKQQLLQAYSAATQVAAISYSLYNSPRTNTYSLASLQSEHHHPGTHQQTSEPSIRRILADTGCI
jgi:hypothetical protein